MDKHTVALKTVVQAAARIVNASGFGIRGKVEVFGNLVVCRYQHGPFVVTLQVLFAPELQMEMLIDSHASQGEEVDSYLETANIYYANVKDRLENTLSIWNIQAV